jgi:hypothetical protein
VSFVCAEQEVVHRIIGLVRSDVILALLDGGVKGSQALAHFLCVRGLGEEAAGNWSDFRLALLLVVVRVAMGHVEMQLEKQAWGVEGAERLLASQRAGRCCLLEQPSSRSVLRG